VFLHAAEISFTHPATGKPVTFCAPANFDADPRLALRAALIDPRETDAFRVIHGASDGWPGWYVERLGKFLLSQSEQPLRAEQREELARLAKLFSARGVSQNPVAAGAAHDRSRGIAATGLGRSRAGAV
jgi:23S rRNA G2069 N7-methylase RlmK/C1962 C5-methylase RlmI